MGPISVYGIRVDVALQRRDNRVASLERGRAAGTTRPQPTRDVTRADKLSICQNEEAVMLTEAAAQAVQGAITEFR